jgi:hypothetical protein
MHDASYEAGHPERWVCDRGFLRAMLGDSLRASRVTAMWALGIVAWVLWIAVRLGGWASYNRAKK